MSTSRFTSASNRMLAFLTAWSLLLLSPNGWGQLGTGGKGDYYPLIPGTRWDFRIKIGDDVKGSISEVVAELETINNVPLVRLEAQVQGKVVATEHLRITPQGIYRYRAQGAEAKPPVLVLPNPVKPGDVWKVDSQYGAEKVRGTCKTRQEEVEVPAGKFKALAVEIDFTVQEKPIKTTIWYAQGVGKVKQTLDFGGGQTLTLELEKYLGAAGK